MNIFLFLCFFVGLHRQRVSSQGIASTPPKGWNSHKSFGWTISEKEFLQNAEIVSTKLLPHGYEYVVVDYLWHRRNVPGAGMDSLGFDVIDEWGRPIPDPDRWPSSKGGIGFSAVADKVHKMGLKFGITVMKGVSTQAVNAKSPVQDPNMGVVFNDGKQNWTAKDVGIKEKACGWMKNGFMSVDVSLEAGDHFLYDLYQLYTSWGVDFVKLDCVFGEDLDVNEIRPASFYMKMQDAYWKSQNVSLSVSPGNRATPMMAKNITGVVDMYRITGDVWDAWGDVIACFDAARNFAYANMIGTNNSWPDLDTLPLGWLGDAGSNGGPHRMTNLTLAEQRTLMTLWCMAKSPLMFGGDMRKLDDTTLSVLTNPTMLEINSFSSKNQEFPFRESEGLRSWVATGRRGEMYVAFFNLNSKETKITAQTLDFTNAFPPIGKVGGCKGTEAWSGRSLGNVDSSMSIALEPHGSAVVVIHCD